LMTCGLVRFAARVDRSSGCRSEALRSWVSLCGEIDLASAPHLRQVLDTLCREGHSEIVLDLSELESWALSGWKYFCALMNTCVP
jgi:anti-anti-sigma regulatory factor